MQDQRPGAGELSIGPATGLQNWKLVIGLQDWKLATGQPDSRVSLALDRVSGALGSREKQRFQASLWKASQKIEPGKD